MYPLMYGTSIFNTAQGQPSNLPMNVSGQHTVAQPPPPEGEATWWTPFITGILTPALLGKLIRTSPLFKFDFKLKGDKYQIPYTPNLFLNIAGLSAGTWLYNSTNPTVSNGWKNYGNGVFWGSALYLILSALWSTVLSGTALGALALEN